MEKCLESQTIYQGKIIEVTKDKIEAYNGNKATREVVHHHGGVSIIALEDECLLLVKQYRYPFQEETLEIPAGKLEKDEDPLAASFREFEEETNRRAEFMKFIMTIYPTPGYCTEILNLYEAINFKEVKDSLPCDEDEDLKIIKMPLQDAYAKVLNGTIKDAKTVIAILYLVSRKS